YMSNGSVQTSEVETFKVIIPKRKIVIEDYTGAWCGYCPRVSAAIEAIREVTDDIAVIAIHNDDAMAVAFEEDLRDEFGVSGFPAGRVNRTLNWSNPHPIETVTDIAGLDTNIAIAIRSQLNGQDLAVEVNVVSEDALENLKLVVYLVEDGILSDQVNYFNADENSPYFGQGNPIENFVNEDVLRASLSNILGDPIEATPALQEYTRTYSTSLNASFDPSKMHIIAMVVQEDQTALNAQVTTLDTFQEYE
ncbi:MAG: Omp28-related outer membrane protein, partial [Flavobacteriaceae bacterium]|nr:Omp28-related outer membrane protein [Flavobacteriaceae bacterium]